MAAVVAPMRSGEGTLGADFLARRSASPHGEVVRLSAPRGGTYVLTMLPRAGSDEFVRLRTRVRASEPAIRYVPAAGRTHYLVHSTGPAELEFLGREIGFARIAPAGLGNIFTRWRARRKDHRHQVELAEGVSIVPLLRAFGREKRELARALKLIRNWGFGVSTRNFQETQDLLAGPPATGACPWTPSPSDKGPPRFAVVLHLYYPELWPEIAAYLGRLERPFKLIATTAPGNADLAGDIRAVFPDADVVICENRGRDVGPFVELLATGRLDGFEFICKIHGKRTAAEGPRALLGSVWRRSTLFDLVGSQSGVDRILARFDQSPGIAMIGSARFRLPNEFIPHGHAWGENRAMTLDLAKQIGVAAEAVRLDYFAGTMFWARRSVLEPLRALGLRLASFPAEDGTHDGRLHHAVERLFGLLPPACGMFVESAPLEFTPIKWPAAANKTEQPPQ